MSLLDAQDLRKAYGNLVLFDGISFTVGQGEKIGLIGHNGSGKTTLLGILAGVVDADDGLVHRRKGSRVTYVEQEPELDLTLTAREIVGQAFSELRACIDAFHAVTAKLADGATAELLDEQADMQAEIERLGGWDWTHGVVGMLDKLGLAEEDVDRPLSELSGGMRRRVALARALLPRPELLLLDEPTNHLDAETVEWLESELMSYPGAILLITHDRYFLDRVVSRIIEIDTDGVHSHEGAYASFVQSKSERLRLHEKAEEKRKKLAQRELEWLRRGPKARTSKSKSRMDKAVALQERGYQAQDRTLGLEFQTDQKLHGVILEIRGVHKSYDDLPVLSDVQLMLRRTDKIGLVGPNGCGKSTLLRMMVGEERPDAGQITWGKSPRVAYMTQSRDELDPTATVYDALHPGDSLRVGKRNVHKRTFLQEFLFDRLDQEKRVETLSGGERCRLLLARMMLLNANFLVLDEPTNDLDITSLQFLENALADFEGCAVVATHDRYLLNRVCNAIVAYEDGAFVRYDGDWDFYSRRRAQRRAEKKEAARQVEARAPTPAAPVERPAAAKLTWKEERELAGMEAAIQGADARKEALEASLADPALYQGNPDKIAALTKRLNLVITEIAKLYDRWEELESRS